MAVVTASPVELTEADVELTDDQVSAFLEDLGRSGSVRGSARAIGVGNRGRLRLFERRHRDAEFRSAWDAALTRRLHDASADLFAAIEDFKRLRAGGEWEDELINLSFDETEDPPHHPRVDPDRLAAAREHLNAAGGKWAAAVVQVNQRKVEREKLECEVAMLWDANLTADEVSEQLGVSPARVRRIARGLGLDLNDARRLGASAIDEQVA